MSGDNATHYETDFGSCVTLQEAIRAGSAQASLDDDESCVAFGNAVNNIINGRDETIRWDGTPEHLTGGQHRASDCPNH